MKRSKRYIKKQTKSLINNDNWIMSVDANNTDLAILSVYYHIDWKECRCLKGVKLEDVTPELEQKAFEEMK